MSQWLAERGHAVHAPCGLAADGTCPGDNALPFGGVAPTMPCENTLPTSSFCHAPDGSVNDAYCTCELAAEEHPCGTTVMVDGLAALDMDMECARFCGKCPSERPPLFPEACAPAMETPCQDSGSFPYYCTKASAETASPLMSAHQDAEDGFWMPDGVDSVHGSYTGDAALCDCSSSLIAANPSSSASLPTVVQMSLLAFAILLHF